jgi:hypothetical protein
MTTLGLVVKMLTGLQHVVPEDYDNYQSFNFNETEQ